MIFFLSKYITNSLPNEKVIKENEAQEWREEKKDLELSLEVNFFSGFCDIFGICFLSLQFGVISFLIIHIHFHNFFKQFLEYLKNIRTLKQSQKMMKEGELEGTPRN